MEIANSPESIKQIAELAIKGLAQKDIAKRLGVSQPTISRRINDHKEIIEQIRDTLVNKASQKAAENIKYAIDAYQDEDKASDRLLRDHGFKASLRVLEGMGILALQAPQNLLVIQNNNLSLSPVIRGILEEKGMETIDLEPVDGEE